MVTVIKLLIIIIKYDKIFFITTVSYCKLNSIFIEQLLTSSNKMCVKSPGGGGGGGLEYKKGRGARRLT